MCNASANIAVIFVGFRPEAMIHHSDHSTQSLRSHSATAELPSKITERLKLQRPIGPARCVANLATTRAGA